MQNTRIIDRPINRQAASEARAILRANIGRRGRVPTIAELDELCNSYVVPKPERTRKRGYLKAIFSF